MNDPRFPSQPANSDDEERRRQRAAMAETLQQALRSIGTTSGQSGGSGLTPEALQELARRAGIPAASQGELARMIGTTPIINGVDVSSAPQHIVFGLHEVECALPAEAVGGVERLGEVTPVPNTAPWVSGIIHLRGSILSVVDLRAFFGLPPQAATVRSRLLVVNSREMTIGLLVDGVNEMRSLADYPDAPYGFLPAWASPYAERAAEVEGRMILLLDPARVLISDRMQHYRAEPV
jgi:purine-binding chemotaxis protein CheW